MPSDRMRDLLALSDLKRWNVIPTTKEQTVGQHTFRVAVIAWEIAERYYNLPPDKRSDYIFPFNDVIRAALTHDGAECLTGDQPSNIKGILVEKGIDWEKLEQELCPWLWSYGEPVDALIGIADKIESGAWLSLYGAHGTAALVIELKFQAHKRSIQLDHDIPGVMKVAMEVAGEVWNNEWPVIYSRKKKEVSK